MIMLQKLSMNTLISSVIARNSRLIVTKNVSRKLNRKFHISAKRQVEFTSVRYPKLKRGNFSTVTDADVARFEQILPGAERVITEPSELEGYNTDWIKNCRGLWLLIFQVSRDTVLLHLYRQQPFFLKSLAF